MAQRIRLDVESIERGVDLLKQEAAKVGHLLRGVQLLSLTEFSRLTGFKQAGEMLGHVSEAASDEAGKVYASHLLDQANTSQICLDNMLQRDGTLSGVLDHIAVGGFSQLHQGLGQIQAVQGLRNMKATAFSNVIPPALPPGSLGTLDRMLAGSNVPAATTEEANWLYLAGEIAASVERLFGVKEAFASSMETAWVQRADERLNKIQRAADSHRLRAKAMAHHTGALGKVTMQEQAWAAVASSIAKTLPAYVRVPYEASYLSAYAGRGTGMLIPTVPSFAKLFPDLDKISGDPFSIKDMSEPKAPEFDRTPLPKIIRDSFNAFGHPGLANATTPDEVLSEYGQINPDTLDAIRSGATQTQAASVNAPSMPATLNPGATPGAGPGAFGPAGGPGSLTANTPAGLGAVSPAGAGSRAAAGGATAPGLGAFGGGMGAGGQRGTAGSTAGVSGLSGGSASGAGRGPAGIPGGFGFGSGGGAGGGAGRGGFGVGAGVGTGAGTGAGAGSGAGGGTGRGGAGGFIGGAPASGAGAAHGNQARGGGFAGGPMAGAAGGRGNNGKQGAKVQAVTSAVERDGNLRALLGDAPLTLPTVIGDNVRD